MSPPPGASSGGELPQRVCHTCWKKKWVVRELRRRKTWDLVHSSVEGPLPSRSGLCMQQKEGGCACGAAWRMLPRRCVDCVGAKTRLAKLLDEQGVAEVAPRTFLRPKLLVEYINERRRVTFWNSAKRNSDDPERAASSCRGDDYGDEYGRWFVKVSHLNARTGVRCLPSAEAAEQYDQELRQTKPKWWSWVIQAEVPRPVLVHRPGVVGGHKVLIRLWGLLTVAHGGGGPPRVAVHISRRMRVNAMLAAYDPLAGDPDGDVKNSEGGIFEDTENDWELYEPLWREASARAERVAGAIARRWEANEKERPPPPAAPGRGWWNILGFDFVPSSGAGGDDAGPAGPEPFLIEVNTDPSLCHHCDETEGFADELTDFFVESVVVDGYVSQDDRTYRCSTDRFVTLPIPYDPR